MSIIRVTNLSKTFAGQQALHSVGMEVQQGQMVALLGPSGSGNPRCFAI